MRRAAVALVFLVAGVISVPVGESMKQNVPGGLKHKAFIFLENKITSGEGGGVSQEE